MPVRPRAQRIDQVGMGVPQRVDGDAAGKIEIALAVGRDQPSSFASLEGEVDAGIGRQQVRGHGTGLARQLVGFDDGLDGKRNVPPLRAARSILYFAPGSCQHDAARSKAGKVPPATARNAMSCG